MQKKNPLIIYLLCSYLHDFDPISSIILSFELKHCHHVSILHESTSDSRSTLFYIDSGH